MKEIKLQRYLQDCGLASRRDIRGWIHDGKIKVNQRTVTDPNFPVRTPGDRIHLRNKLLKLTPQGKSYFLFNKPVGIVSTLDDPQGRATVRSFLTRIKERVYPVGRLDYNSDGLMLLTNDGDLANFILAAKNQVPKTYLLKIKGNLSEATQKKLEKEFQNREQEIQTFTSALSGDNHLAGLNLRWGLSYAQSEADFPFDFQTIFVGLDGMKPSPMLRSNPEQLIGYANKNYDEAGLSWAGDHRGRLASLTPYYPNPMELWHGLDHAVACGALELQSSRNCLHTSRC